jgi:hypothetical protein
MPVETRFLRLRQPVALGHRIEGWWVCWLGGWDRHRIFYVVMVSRLKAEAGMFATDHQQTERASPHARRGKAEDGF